MKYLLKWISNFLYYLHTLTRIQHNVDLNRYCSLLLNYLDRLNINNQFVSVSSFKESTTATAIFIDWSVVTRYFHCHCSAPQQPPTVISPSVAVQCLVQLTASVATTTASVVAQQQLQCPRHRDPRPCASVQSWLLETEPTGCGHHNNTTADGG